MTQPKKRTQTEERARKRFLRTLHIYDSESVLEFALQEIIPVEWATLEDDMPENEPKVKITLLLDKSVAQFFRAMGPGYQARINQVLKLFAQMRIAKVESRWDELYKEHPLLLDPMALAMRKEREAKGE